MGRSFYFVVAALVAASLVGCGSGAGPPANMEAVGTWEHIAAYQPNDNMANQQMVLVISSDAKFTLDVSGTMNKGTWAQSDNLLTLTYADVEGPVPGDGSTAVFAISESGTSIQTMPGESRSITVFSRKTK